MRLSRLCACLGLAVLAGCGPDSAEITLDPGKRFQTISGWEATAALPDDPNAPEWAGYREEQLDRIVDEVGINRLRLEIRSGAENGSGYVRRFIAGEMGFGEWRHLRYHVANDNDDPFVIDPEGFDFAELDWHVENTVLPIRDRLAARGEPLIVNLCFVSFDEGQTFHMQAEEYAEFVLATYLHLDEKYGFTPDMWEVILEPDLLSDGWSGRQMGKAMVAAARRLEAHGFTPAFVAPSVTDMTNTLPYLQAIASVGGAMDHVVELSYHRYRGRGEAMLREIAAAARAYGLRPAMTEWWFGRGTYQVLHEDLTIGRNGAWQGRVESGLHDWDGARLRPKPEVRYTQQYFRHVRHGAVRIGALSDVRGFAPVAFINADGRYTVVVKAARGGEVTVTGLPAGRYRVSYAVSGGSTERPEPVPTDADGRLTAMIPGSGVLTIAAE